MAGSNAQALDVDFGASQAGMGYAAGHLALAVSVFADRLHTRAEIADDAAAAGFRLACQGPVGALLEGPATGPELVLGEVVLIDAPVIDAATLAALARVDLRAARSGAHLVVSPAWPRSTTCSPASTSRARRSWSRRAAPSG